MTDEITLPKLLWRTAVVAAQFVMALILFIVGVKQPWPSCVIYFALSVIVSSVGDMKR